MTTRCFANAEEREIEKIYRAGGFSSVAIAEQYHCSGPTIRNAIRHVDGKMRTPQETYARQVARLGKGPNMCFTRAEETEIEKVYRVSRLSAKAIAKQYRCSYTAIRNAIRRSGGKVRTCREASILRHPSLVFVNDGKYPAITISRLKGNACALAAQMVGSAEDIPVHRLVMALHLHRPLFPTEIVHHRDGNRINYHISNLELLTRRIHTTAWGNPYYQKWQEALSEIRELKAKIEKEVCRG